MSKQPTFVTLTKLQNREPTLLQTAIDNTCGKLNVALKSFHYEVGYHNLDAHTSFYFDPIISYEDTLTYIDRLLKSRRVFTLWGGGLYTFEDISRFFMESVPGVTLRLSLYGLVEFYVPETLGTITLDKQLRRLLGITKRWAGVEIVGKYLGDVRLN